jgi:hypothetical protein
MAITINGTGTIAGISVGGLENGCVNEADLATAAVTNAKLASNAVTIDKLGTTEQSQLCKAWVNFNGTGTVAIRASYNVSSITDNGTGDYTVNFTNALANANYSLMGTVSNTIDNWSNTFAGPTRGVCGIQQSGSIQPTTSACRIESGYGYSTSGNGAYADFSAIYVAIFR